MVLIVSSFAASCQSKDTNSNGCCYCWICQSKSTYTGLAFLMFFHIIHYIYHHPVVYCCFIQKIALIYYMPFHFLTVISHIADSSHLKSWSRSSRACFISFACDKNLSPRWGQIPMFHIVCTMKPIIFLLFSRESTLWCLHCILYARFCVQHDSI